MPGPAVYRHKPTIIHAMQYTRPNVPLLSAWLARTWPGGYQFSGDDSHLLIETPEGDRDCSIEEGYWIAEGIRGECYCIRCDIFAASYELVGEGVMFAALTTMETATLLQSLIDAAEASGAYYPGDDFAREGTLGYELHQLRVEVREAFLRKFFEVNPDRYVPLYGAVD